MHTEFNGTSKLGRSIFAIAALLCTVMVVGSIAGLAEHYGASFQATGTPAIVMARR